MATLVRLLHNKHVICVCLKKAKQRPDRKGQPGRQFNPETFFPLQRGVCINTLYRNRGSKVPKTLLSVE